MEQSRSQFQIIQESGYWVALFGLGLNYKLTSDLDPGEFLCQAHEIPTEVHKRLEKVAAGLCDKNDGHNKFLRQIQVWMRVKASRAFYQEFDTYAVGVSKSSESTMHTLLKRPLTQDDFEVDIDPYFIEVVNKFIAEKDLKGAKAHLPESFLQQRIINCNYCVLRNILGQRKSHKLVQWQKFIETVKKELEHPQLLQGVI